MTKILREGIIDRNTIRIFSDVKYSHACLYKKNEKYDYDCNTLLSTARGSWIDNL